MRVYLVRHGQTEWNLARRAQGHTDIPLDETGLAQAASLEAPFAAIRLSAVFTSDLQRAKETAAVIARATGSELRERQDLRERSFGVHEGQPFDAIARRFEEAAAGGEDVLSARIGGGESILDVWHRLDPFVKELRTMPGNVAVVTHGGTSALLAAHLIAGTPATSRAFRFANAGITELQRRPEGTFLILRYNDIAHLPEPTLAGSLDGVHR